MDEDHLSHDSKSNSNLQRSYKNLIYYFYLNDKVIPNKSIVDRLNDLQNLKANSAQIESKNLEKDFLHEAKSNAGLASVLKPDGHYRH